MAFKWLEGKLNFDRMTENNLHVKLKPVVEVFSTNEVLLVLSKIFSRKAFELLATLIRIEFKIANTCNKFFLRKKVLNRDSAGQRVTNAFFHEPCRPG